MKILHIISGLNNGGAEGVLYRLCKHDSTACHIVVSLTDQGKFGPLLKSDGIELFCVNLSLGKIPVFALWRLFKFIRLQNPHIVQTWMYHADLIGGVVARFAGISKVFWNIRHTTLDQTQSKKLTILVAHLCAFLSVVVPKRIVCCAEEAARVHADLGYKSSKITVIPNGYDLSYFSINPQAGSEFKAEINLKPGQVLLGMVGRFDPQKDHFGLFSALAIVKEVHPDFRFVFVGKQMCESNTELVRAINYHNLHANIVLLEQRNDIYAVMNGIDLHVLSSSYGEAFPNVIAEAMACGTPCVTTNVGDAAIIVGETGWVVPPKDTQALANAILKAIEEMLFLPEDWLKRQHACRDKIFENFSIETMINDYKRVWSLY